MNRVRIFGEDTEFGRWMREHQRLPSSVFVATDQDFCIHRYKDEVDGVGTRLLQHMGIVEAKSHGGWPSSSQQDTLWKFHLALPDGKNSTTFRTPMSHLVKQWGVAVVRMESSDPDNGGIGWYRFDKQGNLQGVPISSDRLIDLMLFERHWDNHKDKAGRRHHKTHVVVESVTTPLGLVVEKPIIYRS